MVFQNDIIAGASGAGGGYTIDQSIRFNNDDTPVLSRTFGTPTDRNKFTYSFWVKPSSQANGNALETNVTGGVTFSSMILDGGNMAFYDYSGGSAQVDVRTTFTSEVGKFRDYSAWYHAVFVYDSDQGTDSNRLKFYINGVQFPVANLVGPLGGSPVWPSSGYNSQFNNNVVHRISSSVNGLIDGYMAEIYFIDGQALDAASFGEVDSTTGQWVPLDASGLTFGNNGFYITGEDSADLGADYSGNSNDFTSSGLTSADQMFDTPTDNYLTFNSLYPAPNSGTNGYRDGNLEVFTSGIGSSISARANTIQVTSGKFYAEMTCTAIGSNVDIFQQVGIIPFRVYAPDGQNFNGSSWSGGTGDYASWTTNDVIGMAVDVDAGTIDWYKNNSLQGQLTFPANSETFFFAQPQNGSQFVWNFGQQPYTYTPPTGFKAVSTANLPDPTIADPSAHFQATIYTGDGSSSHEINQTGNSVFEPSMVWIKSRSAATLHAVQDQVRGNFVFYPNLTNAEGSTGGGWVKSFDSDGFTTDVNVQINDSGQTFVAWQWKANGSGSSNTDGSINTTATSVNTTAGFSISTYTGTGSNATVGHGLGIAPKMVIVKRRDSTSSWRVYHAGLTSAAYVLNMESTGGQGVVATVWNSTAPTSTVFSIGTNAEVNTSGGTYVAYCFAEVEGFSKFGSYTGNGSTEGPFIYTGFKPAFVMTKRTNGASDWKMWDNERRTYNTNDLTLAANTSGVESSGVAQYNDLVSNGFKIRGNDTETNGSGSTYIYMAFGSPFKTATAR